MNPMHRMQSRKSKLRTALSCGTVLSSVLIVPVMAQAEPLDVITVTAQKREADQQDTSIALNVLGETRLSDENARNFEDYVQLLPNVNFSSRGPGVAQIYMRGAATSDIGQSINSQSPLPVVGLYLDEQPVTDLFGNLDIHIYDVARIEALGGPQGTLYGANSMAGTLRIITNKPDPSGFDAQVEASVGDTRDGEMSTTVQGFFNVPITDNFAVRAVAWSVNEGGYIDNVLGTRAHSVTPGFDNDPANAVGTLTVGPNSALAEEDFNDVTKIGYRTSFLWDVNEDWRISASVIGQKLDSEGVFDHDPRTVGDLDVIRFIPDVTEQQFTQVSWTVEGSLGFLDALYAGSFLDRDRKALADYTSYGDAGPYIDYYTCSFQPDFSDLIVPGDANASCVQQNYFTEFDFNSRRNTHELRFATPADEIVSAVVGVFYQDSKLDNLGIFGFTDPRLLVAGDGNPGFSDVAIADAGTIQGPAGSTFLISTERDERQIAVFGEITFQIIPDLLSITGGARWFDIESTLTGVLGGQFGPSGASPLDRSRTDTDVIFKGNVTVTPTDNLLFYATFSQGFRPGFFNRNAGPANFGVTIPDGTDPDVLDNYEIGWKTTLVDGRLVWNGAAYYVDWEDLQYMIYNLNLSQLAFGTNSGDAEIWGLETDFAYAATDNLVIRAAVSLNNAEMAEDFVAPGGTAEVIEIAAGEDLAFAPTFRGSLSMRYETEEFGDGYVGHFRGSVAYTGEQFSSNLAELRELQDSYVLGNIGVGVTKGDLMAEIFVNNIGDSRPELFINNAEVGVTPRITTSRPRTIGLRASYSFN